MSDDPIEEFKNTVDKVGKAFQQAGHVLTAQAAMGWVMRGDLDPARNTLRAHGGAGHTRVAGQALRNL